MSVEFLNQLVRDSITERSRFPKPSFAARGQSGEEESLHVCVVFDTGSSARRAKEFVWRVCQSIPFKTAMFRLDDALAPPFGNDSARLVAHADLLIMAMQSDGKLPHFVTAWLWQWLGLRPESREAALVALLPSNSALPDPRSSLIAHLESVASAGKLAFFYGVTPGSHSDTNITRAHWRSPYCPISPPSLPGVTSSPAETI